MSISEKLTLIIETALGNLGISGVHFTLEHPTELSHGDFACNVAMVAMRKLATSTDSHVDQIILAEKNLNFPKNPLDLAKIISGELIKSEIEEIGKIEVAGPGFINITLSKKYFVGLNEEIKKSGSDFGKISNYTGKKILVEHSSPNLFKPFHIGHMMNNAIGESLVRLMEFSGAQVKTTSFPSDLSLGIGKAVWYLLNNSDINIRNEGHTLNQQLAILGDAYVQGTRAYEDTPEIHDEVKRITDVLYSQNPGPEKDLYMLCKDINMKYFEETVFRLGSKFTEGYIYESEAGAVGKSIVEENVPNVFTKSEGAIVYIPEESKKSLNTAVFINSQGNPTYEAKDIGLLDLKFERIHPDLSLFVTDHEQIPHFKIVLDAAEKINKSWAEKSIHISHGRMSFKGQKMSSRLGGVPLATDIIDMVLGEVSEIGEGRPIANDGEIAEAVAIGAIKFAILRAKPGQNINFDPDTSLSFEGDSGPYLQYTHARILSVIEKAAEAGLYPAYSETENIVDLERVQLQFETVVANAIVEYAPQYVVTYLLELARAFNAFYATNKIVDSEKSETSEHRLAIAYATQIILKNGLWLLGIEAPDKM